jgi:pentatricopeptide repeat-containing protein PET309
MMTEVIPTRHRSTRRQPPHPARSLRFLPSLLTVAGTHASQRRHASNTSDTPPSPSPSIPDLEGIAWQKFLWHMNSAAEEFDADVVWQTFESLGGRRDFLKPKDILLFVERVATHVERLYDGTDTLDSLHAWGHRIRPLLDDVGNQITPLSDLDDQHRCLKIRAMALAGDTEQATSGLHSSVDSEDMVGVLVAYESLVKSIWRHYDANRVLDFLVLEWKSLGSHLIRRSARGYLGDVARNSHRLRQTAHDIIATIAEPAIVMAERQDWTEDRRFKTGQLLIEVLCIRDLPEDALAVLEEMERQSTPIPMSLKLTLVRALVRADAFERANMLFRSLTLKHTNFKYYLSTGLHLFAHQGDVARVQEKWVQLEDIGGVSIADVAMVLQVHAVHGNTEEVVRLFDEFFTTPVSDDTQIYVPTIVHYTIVIYAHAQRGDYDGMNVWLEKMSKAGISPDEYVYSVILKSFAKRGEVDSLAAVLDQMRSAGMQPSAIQYTSAITLLAQRRDPVGAEALYKQAIGEGVVPDRRMVTALMNAHVEAASWQGVIRAFDYLKSSPTRHMRLSIEVYNTLLKAYVLIGAPFRIVSNLFSKLESARVRPDSYTFALLIQSACDAGRMDIAFEIYQKMDRLTQHWESNLHINAYVLTIIMAGFLRKNDKVRAKSVYDEMRVRNIQPDSMTFAAILKAYGKENTEESLRIAENFLSSLMDAEEKPWIQPTGGHSSALEHVFRPLMDVYARQEKPEEVERHFQKMLDAGGEATLGVLTALLYAYCRSGRIASALQVWPQIFQLGLRYFRTDSLFSGQNKAQGEDDESESQTKRQANILCVPLSIYMDALSAAGMHLEIAAVWKKMKMHGFTFDSQNWNHLAIALTRAGEPERAFEVLEKVILPYQQRSREILTERNQQPEDPLTFEPGKDEETDVEPAFEGPSHNRERRAIAVKVATQRSKFGQLASNAGPENDFAHSLHILHQVSPSWSIWRPNGVTLGLLGKVLASLESGVPVQPVKPDQKNPAGGPDRGKGKTEG